MRFGGAAFIVAGLILILISGELFNLPGNLDPGFEGRTAEFLLRSGFGVLLIGLLAVFLFSVKTVPKELMDPLIQTEG
ncbi:MAG: hypothetical protein ABFR50_12415, partial [Candidatus Fermentibacteria bacterium]